MSSFLHTAVHQLLDASHNGDQKGHTQVTCPKVFVQNGVVQIPKFDAKPNPNPNSHLNPDPNTSQRRRN